VVYFYLVHGKTNYFVIYTNDLYLVLHIVLHVSAKEAFNGELPAANHDLTWTEGTITLPSL